MEKINLNYELKALAVMAGAFYAFCNCSDSTPGVEAVDQ